jgi:hypothetical protein
MKTKKQIPWFMIYGSSKRLTAEHIKVLQPFKTEDDFVKFFNEKFYHRILRSRKKISIIDSAEWIIENAGSKFPPVEGTIRKLILDGKPFSADVGYRKEDDKLIPDHLAVFDPEDVSIEIGGHKIDGFASGDIVLFDGRPLWKKITMTIRAMAATVISEIKEAFPFLWHDRHWEPFV